MSSIRVHFLGTGTSTALPVGPCLAEVEKPSRDVGLFLDAYNAAPQAERTPERWGGYEPKAEWPSSVPCGSCRGAVDPRVPEGWKNRRGNPSLVLRKQNKEGVYRNVVVDVGKTFREQSCKLFPRWGIKRIDAVLITHGHADAYNGLDDLREWCGRQGSAIPVYLDRATFETVAASFPYLVDKTKASGGGDLPSLKFVVIDDECEFDVEGITVTTLPVHHGRYFHAPAAPAPAPAPSAPATRAGSPSAANPVAPTPGGPPQVNPHTPHTEPAIEPFWCLGFVFDHQVVYLSDVSSVPERTWKRLEAALDPKLAPVLIVDSLWAWRSHASHVSFAEAMAIALRIKPVMTYIVGMTHPVTHWMWEEIGRSVRGAGIREPKHKDALLAEDLIQKVWEAKEIAEVKDDIKKWGGEVEPAWDGLGLRVTDNGSEMLPHGSGSAGGWGF